MLPQLISRKNLNAENSKILVGNTELYECERFDEKKSPCMPLLDTFFVTKSNKRTGFHQK